MYAFIEGILEEAGPLNATLNVGGVGYFIEVPVTTAERLPKLGESTRLWIHPVIREDAHLLYGFKDKEERDFFRLITEKVSGIGPKIALSLLSKLSLTILQQAIVHQDVALISQCPGIGKKTAERLCIELRDKIPTFAGPGASKNNSVASSSLPPIAGSHIQDAVTALMTLGYKLEVADKAVRRAVENLGKDASTESLIKAALK